MHHVQLRRGRICEYLSPGDRSGMFLFAVERDSQGINVNEQLAGEFVQKITRRFG